ncbi:uncharacterized protein IUM83_16065 [Phytophthora cinnamomi]|uniref:uncharacterized protein n=1 Tax=Phytophthora cinnamomi TaxID=4785 RepID=UPI0035598048|nr:hypothetical protein IUM83_16065 [Phytophthora cinnamomi]
MGGRNREQAASSAATDSAAERSCNEPVAKKQKKEQPDDDVRCGTVSSKLTEEQHKYLLVLDKTYPKWKNPRTAPPKISYGHKQKRELNRLRRFKKQHNVKVDKEGTAGNSAQNEELSELIKQMEMMGKEVEEARNAKQEAEEHNAFLNRVVSVKNEEIKDLQLKVRAEKKKVAVFGKQLEAANAANTSCSTCSTRA